MKMLSLKTFLGLTAALMLLSGCTAHCTCPAQPQPTTTVVTPSN